MLENIIQLLKQDNLQEAAKLCDQLRQEGTPITSIRYHLYPTFKHYQRTDLEKAKKLVEAFGEDYKFRYWL